MTDRLRLPRRVTKLGAALFCTAASLLVAAQALAADLTAVRLKPSVTVEGADIRMGDLFDGAGDGALSVFGMAPGPGRSMSYSASYVQAKAKQAGLKWDNAENLATVTIARGGAESSDGGEGVASNAMGSNANADDPFAPTQKTPAPRTSAADLKRGDTVQIVYRAPGMQLMATGKSTSDASVGGKARAINLRSNKTVDGVLVSPGRIEAFSFDATDAQTALLETPR